MKKYTHITITALLMTAAAVVVAAAAPSAISNDTRQIHINTVGYRVGFPKIATVSDSASMFIIKRYPSEDFATPTIHVTEPGDTNIDTRQRVWRLDFSHFDTPGTYVITARFPVSGGGTADATSPPFVIADGVFLEAYRALMMGMYLWRCGSATGVDATFNGRRYHHGACHLEDGSLERADNESAGRGHQRGVGGWHDAGDFNKYVVNSGVSIGHMLKAWENFHHVLRNTELIAEARVRDNNIPNLPAFLAEVKWNIDWVATMQFPDGWVSHKLTTIRFPGYIMPDTEGTTRYFMPRSTSATGAFVAVLAQAARIYAPYIPETAELWLEQAKASYEVLIASPRIPAAAADEEVTSITGDYESGRDADQRKWAAAELWETTGDERYLSDLENRSEIQANRSPHLVANDVRMYADWANVNSLAAMTYLNSRREGRDAELLEAIRGRMIGNADSIVSNTRRHGYGRPITNYVWGTNGAVAGSAYTLNQAYRFTGDRKYLDAMHAVLDHLLGRNFQARSFVTGIGHNPPQNPHDRRSIAARSAWPGYLVGGPNIQVLTDGAGNAVAPAGSTCVTAAVCYFDYYPDYARNEIAINWNTAMIYAASAMLPGAAVYPPLPYPGEPYPENELATSVRYVRNPSRGGSAGVANIRVSRVVQTGGLRLNIPPNSRVYTINGRLVATRGVGEAVPVIRQRGVFIVRTREP